MTGAELSTKLLTLWQSKQSIVAEILAVIREVDGQDVARREGATCLTAWLGSKLRINPGTARQMIELARALDTACPATAESLSAGVINEQQASIIAKAVTGLAEHGAALQGEVEKVLLADECVVLAPAQLAAAAGYAVGLVAPELVDELERKRLEETEKRAATDRSLTLSPFGDGTGRIRVTGILGAEAAAAVNAAMEP
ncbi:DUF222 domain-containing protein, partial [Rhizocola hellebori]|uniref:DUF222 domain-containing protein n=1 Tax=Rhizocola hellebori TaxID=1392758 RepID=UPI001941D18A